MDAAAGATLRAHGARLGFWCEPASDGKTTALIIVDGEGRLEVRVVESAGLDGPELYRAIALKLRAVLAATIGPEAAASSAWGAARAAVVSGTGRGRGAIGQRHGTGRFSGTRRRRCAGGVSGASGHGRAGPILRLGRLPSLYAAQLGSDTARGRRRSGRAPRALRSSWRWGRRSKRGRTDGTSAGTVSLFDLPIEVEARWVRRGRSRLSWGGGAFAAAHLSWATASASTGAQQTSFNLGGGVGLAALVRGALGRGIAGEARLYTELPLPGTTYWVQGTPVLERGARVGLELSLVFPSP